MWTSNESLPSRLPSRCVFEMSWLTWFVSLTTRRDHWQQSRLRAKFDTAPNVSRTKPKELFCVVLRLTLYTYDIVFYQIMLFACHVAHWSKLVTWHMYFLLNSPRAKNSCRKWKCYQYRPCMEFKPAMMDRNSFRRKWYSWIELS